MSGLPISLRKPNVTRAPNGSEMESPLAELLPGWEP